jgi:glyoxylase-like metal-dependent hydrolase (beta-lactamase superfamily II)
LQKTRSVTEGIWLIDTFIAEMEGYASVYAVKGESGAALVDSGVSTTVGNILKGLEEAGIAREEVQYVIATHIHVDHAGGAGYLMRELPEARAVVASNGVHTLAQPERLVASARRALGAIMDTYGEMVPIESERLLSAEEAGTLDLGGRALRFIPTPGHASTHICVVDDASGTLFTGDSMGMYLADEGKVIPVTPLPDFDLEEQRRSMERLAALDCGRTCFAHFGCAGECAPLARESLRNMEVMVEAVKEAMRTDADQLETAAELMRLMGVTSHYGTYMFGGMSLQNVQGITRYLRKQSEEGSA